MNLQRRLKLCVLRINPKWEMKFFVTENNIVCSAARFFLLLRNTTLKDTTSQITVKLRRDFHSNPRKESRRDLTENIKEELNCCLALSSALNESTDRRDTA